LYTIHPTPDQMVKRSRKAPLVITFDDGYLDNYTHAFQVIKKLNIPITIFLIPEYAESGKYFWWLADDYLVEHATVDKVVVEGKLYQLSRPQERKALANLIDKRTRNVGSVEERENFLCHIQQVLQVVLPSRQEDGMSNPSLPMNWSEIREMDQSGLVSFGAHTMHHPIIAYLSHPEELRAEVQQCRVVLEQQLGHSIRSFCYPVGKMIHIGEQGVQAVKDAGYKWALTTIEDVNTQQTDPYLLRRLPGDINVHWLVMASELAGLLGNMSRFRKKYARLFKK
jgi:peptidoglycan/xylan/chitin deacetylase (PgdA/CDA1 family)